MSARRFGAGRATLAAVFGCLTLAGCVAGTDGKAPVKGKVVFADGKPLTAGTVVFDNTGEAAADSFEAAIEANGEFAVAGGMTPGKYRIAILPGEEDAADGGDEVEEKPAARRAPVAERFTDSSASGLTAEVAAGDNSFTFTVAPPESDER